MLFQLTYTTEFLPLLNINNQRRNNSGQMYSAQWEELRGKYYLNVWNWSLKC